MPFIHYCGFHNSQVPMVDGMKHHFVWKAEWQKRFLAEIGISIVTVFDNNIPGSPQPMPNPNPHLSEDKSSMEDVDVGEVDDRMEPHVLFVEEEEWELVRC